MSLANLIANFQSRQPNFVDTFQSARSNALKNQYMQNEMQRSKLANQQNMQRQSALQDLIGQGATPESLASGGFFDEAKTLSEINKNTATGNVDPEFLKEQRKLAGEVVRDVSKRSAELYSSYGKLKGLKDQAVGGSRQARAGMIINVARMLSPGIVTDKDFQALTGAADPLAAAMAMLQNKDANIANMLGSYVDPLGNAFNADALLNIATASAKSESEALMNRYDDAKARGVRSGMNERQLNTIFGGNKTLDALRGISTGYVPVVQPQQPQEKPKTAAQRRQELLDKY